MTSPKTASVAARERRRRTGAWYTPPHLIELVVERTVTVEWLAGFDRPIRLLDPACGDGRFLSAAARAVEALGGQVEMTAVDVDPAALVAVDAEPGLARAERRCADALALDWAGERFDLIVGNPPFLSQMSAATTRRGASRHGGGPYADAAAEFLALAVRLATPGRGRVGLVLPQSILASRDAGAVRAMVDRDTQRLWSWWSPARHFDAEVIVCALGLERRAGVTVPPVDADPEPAHPTWSEIVLDQLGVPPLPALRATGRLGERATLTANFRDEYYALAAAVTGDGDGPALVTSGLIDPGTCRWGHRPVRFAKRLHDAPRVDLDRLDARMQRWAARKLVPKVLVANQTRIIEAVADPAGAWLPGVPVTTVVPEHGTTPEEIAAVLTSPAASAWVWEQAAGTGLSARSIRLGPTLLAGLPWPSGRLSAAVDALGRGDVFGCADEVTAAYGLDRTDAAVVRLSEWWRSEVERVSSPGRPTGGVDRPDAAPDRGLATR